ncbi:MAG: ArnT family glycosyltransferase [Deferribacterales bacterium]
MGKRTGLSALIAFTLVYHLLFFRHAMPVQEGWFQLFGGKILNGQVPYKDFYSFLQPVYLYVHAFLISLFGDGFIVGRIYGIFERILLLSSAYLLLTRFFEPKHVLIALVTSLMVYSSTTTDLILSYYQLCVAFALLSCYFASFYIVDLFSRASLRLLFLGGIFGGLSFLTKQSTGLFVPFAIFIVIVLQAVKTRKLAGVTVYVLGGLLPIALFMLFLHRHGAVADYFTQVFGGTSSKGSISDILFSFFSRAFIPKYLIPFFLITALMVSLRTALVKLLPMRTESDGNLSRLEMFAVFAAFCLAPVLLYIGIDLWSGLYSAWHIRDWFYEVKLQIVFYTFFFIICYFFYYAGRMVFVYEYDRIVVFKALVSAVGLAVMYAHGLSFTIEEHSVIPSMVIMLVFLFSMDYPFVRIKNIVLYSLCFLIILFSAAQKFQWVYSWWGWEEGSVAASNERCSVPKLEGFLLSPEENRIYKSIYDIVTGNTTEKDPIYVFPHMALLYVLTERGYSTRNFLHYFDVCPDKAAEDDAEVLSENPPKVIVYMDFPEDAWKIHEVYFRGGKRSGQRKIDETVKKMTARDYILADSFLTPGYGYPLNVWVRKN